MHADAEPSIVRSFERRQRNLLGTITAGTLVGSVMGAAAAALASGASAIEGALFGSFLGAAVGAALGRVVGARVISKVVEPLASERSYVGAHCPDVPSEVPTRKGGMIRRP